MYDSELLLSRFFNSLVYIAVWCLGSFILNPCYRFHINQKNTAKKLDNRNFDVTKSDFANYEPIMLFDTQVVDLPVAEVGDTVPSVFEESDAEDIFFDSLNSIEGERQDSVNSSGDVYSKNLKLLKDRSTADEENLDWGNKDA